LREAKHILHSPWRKTRLVMGFGLLALLMIGIAGLIWGALVYANLRTSPSLPWSLPAIIIVLWLTWQYLGGKGPPRSTATKRKLLLRANSVSGQAFAWSALAGTLAIGALAGVWIVFARLIRMTPNPLLPGNFASTPLLVACIVIGASLVAPIVEESAVRGYLQTTLEQEFRPATAVMLSSFVFALAHVTQGLSVAKLLVYFLVGVTFGTMAFLNDSILPVIPVHIAADLVFFVFVWPHDATRELIWQSGTDGWFWLHVMQAVGFTVLSFLALRQLSRLRPNNHNNKDVSFAVA
jgi:membrane protease YdiL (CAAX protease family)